MEREEVHFSPLVTCTHCYMITQTTATVISKKKTITTLFNDRRQRSATITRTFWYLKL